MSADEKGFWLRIFGDTSSAEASLNSLGRTSSNLANTIKTVVSAAAVVATTAWVNGSINMAAESQKTATVLDGSMKRILNATDSVIKKNEDWVTALEKSSHIDDTQIRAALNEMVIRYGNLSDAQKAVSVATEATNAGFGNLSSTIETVYMGSQGLSRSLRDFGISTKAGTTETQYLNEMMVKLKGSTSDYSKTLEGQRAANNIIWEEMRKALGNTLIPMESAISKDIQPIVEKLTKYITDHSSDIENSLKKVTDKIGDIVQKILALDLNKVMTFVGWAIGVKGFTALVSVLNGVVTSIASIKTAVVSLTASAGWSAFIGAITSPAGIAALALLAGVGVYAGMKSLAASNYDAKGYSVVGTPAERSHVGNYSVLQGDTVIGVHGSLTSSFQSAAAAASHATTSPSSSHTPSVNPLTDAQKKALQDIANARKELSDKLYTLTHTDEQNELHAIDEEVASYIKAGVSKTEAEQYGNTARNQIRAKYAKQAADDAAQKEKDAAAAAESAWEDANNAMISSANDAYDAIIAQQNKYADDMTSAKNGLAQMFLDEYNNHKDMLNKELSDLKDNLSKQKQAVEDRYQTEINAIDDVKTAQLATVNSQIAQLRAQHDAQQAANERAGLVADISSATTSADLVRAQNALAAFDREAAYNAQLQSLQNQARQIETDAENQKTKARADADKDIAAAQKVYDNQSSLLQKQIDDYQSFYQEKASLAQRNADAEKMLAEQTQDDIISMLNGKMDEWKALGIDINSALFSNVENTISSLQDAIVNSGATSLDLDSGGGGKALKAHALGGWVGVNGPEIALVGERGPEKITSTAEVESQTSLLQQLVSEVRALQKVQASQTLAFARVVKGMVP